MNAIKVICTECPIGCQMEVTVLGDEVTVSGNGCNRGREYARNEVVCPRRVVTSTVRAENGKMVPVKTSSPVVKKDIFAVMDRINSASCHLPVRIGDVIVKAVSEDVDVIATANID